MKKSSLLSLCFGLICAISMGCTGDSKSDSGCTDAVAKCSEDGTAVLSCVDGQEKTTSCANGCAEGKCLECVKGDTQCKEGALWTCGATNVWEKAQDCAQCNGKTCADTADCSYTGTQCHDSKVYECQGGVETKVQDCEYGCNGNTCSAKQETTGCTWTGTQCSSDLVAIVQCIDGVEEETWCDDGYYCEDESGTPTCELIEETVCDGAGKRCLGDTVILCDADGDYTTVESCIGTCTEGKCDSVACPTVAIPSCFDTKTILACDTTTNVMAKTPCETEETCVSGECRQSSAEVECNFETQCSEDGSAIKKCENGVASYEACPVKYYCSDGTELDEVEEGYEIQCRSAMTSNDLGICDEKLFVAACDDNTAYRCENSSLVTETCTKNQICVSGECRNTTTKSIGDTCNPTYFDETCIGEVPVECDSSSKKIVAIKEDCTLDDGICGVISQEGVPEADCFEPCTTLGSMKSKCVGDTDTIYASTQECIDITNGRYGYDYANSSYDTCDIGCAEGKCIDYTEDVKDVGKICSRTATETLTAYQDYCVGYTKAVTCELDVNNEQGNESAEYVVTVELCGATEACVLSDESDGTKKATCLEQCKEGDSSKATCNLGSGIFGSTYVSYPYTCQKVGDIYVYVEGTMSMCKNGCNNDGTCK